ncbi:proteoglycan 4-like [Onychostoma macrolepis]|uniref:proteoglycan 4-like n=1 Tax=Onychostoma macrolepis TaxID=369639 RepID=UPI00272CA6E1|nr:proteoglycan 4-like [Onychostoma macrolepis]
MTRVKKLDRLLEDHTRDFLDLACLTHFPDHLLCVFYIISLSEQCKARLPANGPKEDFAACVEWVLMNNESAFTVGPVEDDITTGPTPPLPETSQPSPRSTEILPEPTADGEPEPAAIEPLPSSDQVREPATSSVAEGVLVELEGLEGSPAHTPTTEGVLQLISGKYEEELREIFQTDLIDWWGEVQTCVPESPVSLLVPSSPESSVPESPVSPLVPSSPESSRAPSRVSAGSVQLKSSFGPSQPPSPASSQASQFFASISADAYQSLSSPSVRTCHALHSAASGLPVFSSAQRCGSPVSTPSLRVLDYTSVLRPIGS